VSVQVVDVEVENQLLDLGLSLYADWTVVDIGVISGITIEKAVVLLISVENSSGYNLEVEQSLWKRR
jgi:hypothetical protein